MVIDSYEEAINTAPEARGLVPEVSEIETGYAGIVGNLDPRDVDENGEPIFAIESHEGFDTLYVRDFATFLEWSGLERI